MQLDDDNINRMGFFYIGASILAHLLFLVALLFLQNVHFTRPLPPVIQVDLISFAPEPVFENMSGGQTDPEEKAVNPKTDITAEPTEVNTNTQTSPPVEVVTKKPDISLKTKPKNLQELIDSQPKKEEKKPEKQPEKKAVEPEKKKPEDPAPKNNEQISVALGRLEKLVQEQQQSRAAGQGTASELDGALQGSGRKNYTPIDLYNMVLASAISQNWVFNDRLANMDKSLETTVLITILKSGQIREVFFETRSGNNYLDESAEKAIRKADPLPELPKGYSIYKVGVIFTPKGLK